MYFPTQHESIFSNHESSAKYLFRPVGYPSVMIFGVCLQNDCKQWCDATKLDCTHCIDRWICVGRLIPRAPQEQWNFVMILGVSFW